MNRASAMIFVVVALVSHDIHAGESLTLKNNPFSRPSSETIVEARSESRSDAAPTPLDLRATLVSVTHRLANVGGHIVRPGDTVGGHVLMQVFEDRAEFLRDGRRVVIYVKPEMVSEDE